jgi:hypothetical protein
MSCEQEIRVGDIGTVLEVELLENCVAGLPVNSATSKTITVVRPDKTSFTRAADFTTDGTDGKIYITTIAADLTMAGTYYIQAYIELASWEGNSGIGDFEVFKNLV